MNENISVIGLVMDALNVEYEDTDQRIRDEAFTTLMREHAFDVRDGKLVMAKPATVRRVVPRIFARLSGPVPGDTAEARITRAMQREASVMPIRRQAPRQHATLQDALAAIPVLGPNATEAQKCARALQVEKTYRAYDYPEDAA